jgi:hypothetical protein
VRAAAINYIWQEQGEGRYALVLHGAAIVSYVRWDKARREYHAIHRETSVAYSPELDEAKATVERL